MHLKKSLSRRGRSGIAASGYGLPFKQRKDR